MKKHKDWRKDYVICEHVHNDPEVKVRHTGMRVCCEACADDFLAVPSDKLEYNHEYDNVASVKK